MDLSARSSGRMRVAAALAVVVLIAAGWLCLVESHDEPDHAMPHDLCAGMVILTVAILTAVVLAPAGALAPGGAPRRPTRAVPVLDPPPRISRAR